MGALHSGHISLITQSKNEHECTVASIFVNPTQFNNKEDFDTYPRLIEQDLLMLHDAACDAVFLPTTHEMFGTDTATATPIVFGPFMHSFEGAHRPGHFDGVVAIVKRLFECVQPDVAYFGQKDYQQCMVVQALVKHYKLPVRISTLQTIRESDGLAMSSRNLRLSAGQRQQATAIYSALLLISNGIKTKQNLPDLLASAQNIIHGAGLKTEYLAVCNAQNLEPATQTAPNNCVILCAAWCGSIRLIDNMLVNT
jgi:pantoate--beta-alanine ligase